MKKLPTRFLFIIALLLSINANSQDGASDPSFNPIDVGFGFGDAANATVYDSEVLSDGKIIISGLFTYYNGTSRNEIARLNTDGTLDATFNGAQGAGGGTIYTTTIQSDGKIIVGGDFISYGGMPRKNLARLNADGSLDATFIVGTGANNNVLTIAVQSDGKIIIGGLFTSYNGTAVNHIARLNIDGSLDATFNIGAGADGAVNTTSIQSDGKIIIGGAFSNYNSIAKSFICRLNTDGSLDATFIGTGSTNGYVRAIQIQSDGKIIIGGQFTIYNSVGKNYITRLNTDGSIDGTFNIGTGANDYVLSITIQSDGKIIIGGQFTSYKGISRNRVARLNTDGSLDAAFAIGTGPGDIVNTTAVQSDGKVIIGGVFINCNGIARNRLVRLNADGSLDFAFIAGTGANSYVSVSAIQSDGKIIIGGSFTSYNNNVTSRNRLARLNADGSLDPTFNVGTGANNEVQAIKIQSDGKIIIGGTFTTYNGTARNRLARLNSDGSLDPTFNVGTGASTYVLAISIQSDGKIIIGGGFAYYNGTTVNYITRLNTDGSLDPTFNVGGTGANVLVRTTSIQSDGKIIIGGNFTSYNGTPIMRVARLNTDGSLDATFYAGTGINNQVWTSAIQSDGKIIVGGFFTAFNITSRKYIARLNTDGSLDPTFNVGTGGDNYVLTVAIQNDGKVIIGGWLTVYNNTASNYIARLNTDGSLDAAFNVGAQANDIISTTALQSDGKIIIGGSFTSYNGTGRNRVTRILASPCSSTPTDPTTPTLSAGSINNCGTQSTTLNIINGTLNSATVWKWYSGSCGGTSLGSGTSVTVSPTSTTTYYARGEGSCITPGTCASITISVNPLPTVTLSSFNSVCTDASDFALTGGSPSGGIYSGIGVNGGNFSPITAGVGTYTITYSYTDANSCQNSANTDLTVMSAIDNTMTVSGTTLSANSSSGTYQWVDCSNSNVQISGATSQNFTPSLSGNYAVIVTVNTCSVTSICNTISITGIVNYAQAEGLSVFPNPNSGDFSISFQKEETFSLINNLGQVVRTIYLNQSNNNSTTIMRGLESGIYFLIGNLNPLLKYKIVVAK